MRSRIAAVSIASAVSLAGLLFSSSALAMPAFARQYEMSCNVCHAAVPRLNGFGEQFRDANMRLPGWREKVALETHDEMLALPKTFPVALRMQAYVQGRQAEEIDPLTGPTGNGAQADFQAPYLLKLLSGAPLSDHISYYFYMIFAEKGENGTVLVEDAWFRHDDLFGSGVAAQLGQFQVGELMFPRETRMTFQDFMAYRMAGITYDRGVTFDRGFGPVDVAIGAVNGNGIEQNFGINSPGYRRPDRMFDNDTRKSVFSRVGTNVGPVRAGAFGLAGKQQSAAGTVGEATGTRDTTKRVYGLDLSGQVGAGLYWFAQLLSNHWDGFLDANPARDYRWTGGFAGIDYVQSPRWTHSLLVNLNGAGDFGGSGTIYEGIEMKTITVATAYYFMRNVKGLVELNVDLLSPDDDPDFVGHETRENYFLVGFDAAF
jgi:hypothetical protein